MTTGIFLYEDNHDLRESIESLLYGIPDFLLLGSFANAEHAERDILEANPDVIMMDIDLPRRNGIEAVKGIRKIKADVLIVMLTVFDDNQHVFEAICAGASGYLLKKDLLEKLAFSIREVVAGGAPMSPGIAKKVIESFRVPQTEKNDSYRLTNRESEILALLARGNSYKMIAADLFISIETIRTHSKKIYEKLHVHSQVEAVSKALREKLI